MKSPTDKDAVQLDDPRSTGLSRRRLLKALATSSGAVAILTAIPDSWAKPVVEVGYLPAHAQASPTPTSTLTPTPPPQNMSLLNCGGDGGGSTPERVPQNGTVTNIQITTSPISPAATELICRFQTSDPNYPPAMFVPTSTFTNKSGTATAPDFSLDDSFFNPPIAIGATIIFTVEFADKTRFGPNTCSFTMTVEAPAQSQSNSATNSPWVKR